MAPNHRDRSPLRERERPISPKRRGEVDYGHDADRTVRHVTRTGQLIIFAGEKGITRDWSWLLQCLAHRRCDRGTGCPVDILPSIIYCDGAPEALYHTGGGTVVSRDIGEDEGCITFAKAMAHLRPRKKYFGALAAATKKGAGEGSSGTNGAVAFTSSGEAVGIKTSDVEKIRKAQSTPPAGTEAMVLLVPTKAPSAELLLSIQHTFALDPCAAKPVHLSYRLVVLKGVPKRIPCQSSTINTKLVRMCKHVIEWVEAYSGARVLRLVLEVVEDTYGHLWLVRSSECSTTKTMLPYSRERRSPSPSQSKAARLHSAKGVANELSILRDGHGIGESALSPTDLSMLETIRMGRGQQTQAPGSCRRAQTAMSPAEASNKQELDAEEWGFETSEFPSRGSPERPRTAVSAIGSSIQDIGVTFQGFAAPGEQDPREVGRTAAAGRALGTSQLSRMCRGDFCNTDLLDKIQQQARFEREETGYGSLVAPPSSPAGRTIGGSAGAGGGEGGGERAGDGADESAFRRKLLKLDEATLQDYGVLPAEGGLMKVRTTEREQSNQKGQEEGGGSGGGRGGRLTQVGVGEGRSKRQRSGIGGGKPECMTGWNEIPLSWVIRGRQESHLIDQQLKRYRRGNKEPFIEHLSGLGESSVSLGALFPGTYYQSVRVCDNCYRVYSMVDEARTKSVKRLDAQASAAAVATGTSYSNAGKARKQGRPHPGKRASDGGGDPGRDEQVSTSAKSKIGLTRVREDGSSGNNGRQTQRPSRACGNGDPPSSPALLFDRREIDMEGERREERRDGSMSESGESLALMRAQAAIDGLTRGDICELRSFAKPPAAVNMVVAALMIALTGQGEPTAAGWLSAKRYMTNIDKLFAEIAGLKLNTLRVSQTRKLEAYIRNPAFRPDIIACVSLPASKICAWVLGVLEAHRWRTGRGHVRINILGQGLGSGDNSTKAGKRPYEAPSRSSSTPLGPTVYPFPPQGTATITTAGADAAGTNAREACDPAFPGSGQFRQSMRGHLTGGNGEQRPTTTSVGFHPRRHLQPPELSPPDWVPPGFGSGSGAAGMVVLSPSRAGTAPATGSGSNRSNRSNTAKFETGRNSQHPAGGRSTRAGRAAAKRRQDRVGERLANASAAAPDPAGFERSEFLCADGITLMPYAVAGSGARLLTIPPADMSGGDAKGARGQEDCTAGVEEGWEYGQDEADPNLGVLSFVVVHDFFDTLEKTFLLFKPLVLKYPGCQVLCFNSPGQAGTRLPPEPEGLLTNTWVADRLDELMQHVDDMGEMPLSDRPFNLLGFGNGANIAAAFACKHSSKSKWRPTLRSLACINGFATVDAQLSAVLHAAQRAFQCFPPERPDLPISFWSRFVFSDSYLKSVGSDLALNILCAVANPLGVEGMLRIVNGALKSRDLTKELKSIALPIVLVQSTENMLIDAANVDPFLEGRHPRHVWSHQLRLRATVPNPTAGRGGDANNSCNSGRFASCLGHGGERALFESLSFGGEGAFVAWAKGGHEMRQECKRLVIDMLDLLAAPGGQTPEFFRRGVQARRPPGGRVGIATKVPSNTGNAANTAAGSAAASMVEEKAPGGGSTTSVAGDKCDGNRPMPIEKEEGIIRVKTPRTVIVESSETAVDALGERGGGRMRGGHGEDDSMECEGGDDGRVLPTEGGRGGTTLGYASMRKIREREPLPELPKSCGRRLRSPNSGSGILNRVSSSKTRKSSRALTAPISAGKQSRDRRGHEDDLRTESSDIPRRTDHQIDERPSSRAATAADVIIREGLGNDKRHQEHEDGVGGEGGGFLTLEAEVADFDIALRNHRDRRRGLGQPVATVTALAGTLDVGGVTEKEFDEGVESQVHDEAASNWLDGEVTSWAKVDLGIHKFPPEKKFMGEEEGGDQQNEPRHSNVDDQTEIRTVPCTPQNPPTLDEAKMFDRYNPMRDEFSAINPAEVETIPASDVSPRLALDEEQPLALEPSLTSSMATPDPSIGNGVLSPEDKFETEVAKTAERTSDKAMKLSLDRTARSKKDSRETSVLSLVTPSEQNAEVVTPDGGIGRGPQETAEVGGRTSNDTVSEGGPAAAPISSGGSEEVVFVTKNTTMSVSPANLADTPYTIMPSGTQGITIRHTTAEVLVSAPQTVLALESIDPIATDVQRKAGDWVKGTAIIPSDISTTNNGDPNRLPMPLEIAEAEAKLADKVDRLHSKRFAAEREEREALDEGRASKYEREGAVRAQGFAEEDRNALAAEEQRLADLRRVADLSRLQSGAEFQEIDEKLAGMGVATPATMTGGTPMPVRSMRPQRFVEQEDMPAAIKENLARPVDKVLDEMEELEARAKAAGGGLTVEAFEKVEKQQQVRQVERMEKLLGQTDEEKRAMMRMMAVRLQLFVRQIIARMRVSKLKHARSTSKGRVAAATTIQSLVRGHLSRRSVQRLRRQLLDESILGGRATVIQRMYRGHLGRLVFASCLRDARCRVLQKAARGFLGRRVAARKRALLARCAARASSATKLQSAWRGKMARDSYLGARCSWLASREIQRLYRGHLGRRATRRRREWLSAGPGPERLKLGLRMIEDTKVAFVKQQGEIAALNRAQEKAEARVSSIHHQLTASESELSVLEGEMTEIDHIERELVQLTHERDLISRGITGAAGIRKTGKPRERDGGGGNGGDHGDGGDDSEDDDRGRGGRGRGRGGGGSRDFREEDVYALEMQLQLKRAEREQRRLQLSVEFASTFADVSEKKRQLDRLSAAVSDIEATRLRKSREFGHMQRNLMELLSEQKRELDIVREKGVKLETAAATSAAAAAATAQRAKDHEAKAAAMYGQTEELMKFQFMSMSLSYFSSLNMMKQMRDINADTTTAAIAGSADAAAAAAASAAAASIPSIKHAGDFGVDEVSRALALRKEQVESAKAEIQEAENSLLHPFPTELGLWTVDDVCRWLDTLQLGEYKQAFREGKVDGSFLAELRESDLMDSIGMEHKLHLKKLLLARQKLTPLSAAEQAMAKSVKREDAASSIREGIPDIDTAFSQARHGKKKRLEETLNAGFEIDAEDAMGNTLLLVAVQQLQIPVVEFLVQRGAAVNHRNTMGNTALHFAMSYDTSGKMGEYLINNGADDTIENKQGLSPYDGI